MWLTILLLILVGCAAAYRFRVPLMAKLLGQPEHRIDRQLKRKRH